MKGKDFQIPLSAPRTPSNTPKHPWTLQNTLRHPKLPPLSPRNSLDCSQALVRQSERLRGVFVSLFPSFAFNLRKSKIRFLTISSRLGGPRCLKYQNIIKLRSFWHIKKPRERLQSWVIRVYFLSVPNDHTTTPFLLTTDVWKVKRGGSGRGGRG